MTVVLIVEDETVEQEFLKSLVSKELNNDDRVLVCGSGLVAIELAKRYKPDIIFMDIMIAELDGLSSIEKIRQFLPHSCISILSAYSDFCYAQKAISLNIYEYLLKPVKPRDFTELFQKILNEISQDKSSQVEEVTHKEIDSSEGQQYFIEQSLKYIKDHFREKLTLEMVASEIYMNPKYFSQVFNKEMGISFSNYVNSLRIKHACRLLETTDFPAYRISMECGFSDPAYFNRVFRNKMNMTPLDYRKQSWKSKK